MSFRKGLFTCRRTEFLNVRLPKSTRGFSLVSHPQQARRHFMTCSGRLYLGIQKCSVVDGHEKNLSLSQHTSPRSSLSRVGIGSWGARRTAPLTRNRYILRKSVLFSGGIFSQNSRSSGQVREAGPHLISSTLNIRPGDRCHQGISCCNDTTWKFELSVLYGHFSPKVGTQPSALLPSTRTHRRYRVQSVLAR